MKNPLYLLILLLITSCSDSDEVGIDMNYGENLFIDGDLYSSGQKVTSITIYKANDAQKDGFVGDLGMLKTFDVSASMDAPESAHFLNQIREVVWKAPGCFESREKQIYHGVVNIEAQKNVGYFIFNECTSGDRKYLAIRFLLENGETAITYSLNQDLLDLITADTVVAIPLESHR